MLQLLILVSAVGGLASRTFHHAAVCTCNYYSKQHRRGFRGAAARPYKRFCRWHLMAHPLAARLAFFERHWAFFGGFGSVCALAAVCAATEIDNIHITVSWSDQGLAVLGTTQCVAAQS